MVALTTVIGPAAALLLLALQPGARAHTARWSQCRPYENLPVLDAGGVQSATALNLRYCDIEILEEGDFNRTALPNLTTILLDSNNLRLIPASVFVPVSHINDTLSLAHNKLLAVPDFGGHELFPRLRELTLSENHIRSIADDNTFSSCVDLEMLNLDHNLIGDISPNVFKQLPKLRILNLKNNEIVSISETIFQIKTLERLDLVHNSIEVVALHAFRGTRLTYLRISHNKLTFLPENFVADLTSLMGPNTGTYLFGDYTWNSFHFSHNPWYCSTLLELFADMKRLGVRYYSSRFEYRGSQRECVFLGRRACGRRAAPALLPAPRRRG